METLLFSLNASYKVVVAASIKAVANCRTEHEKIVFK